MKVVYTSLLPWSGFAPVPWLVLIHERHRGNAALLAHELTHVEQMKRYGLFTFWLRYATRAGRQAYEVEAYRAQIAAGASVEACAGNLARMYFLPLSLDAARQLLTKPQ